MTITKSTLERRTFLASTAATAVVTFAGCDDDQTTESNPNPNGSGSSTEGASTDPTGPGETSTSEARSTTTSSAGSTGSSTTQATSGASGAESSTGPSSTSASGSSTSGSTASETSTNGSDRTEGSSTGESSDNGSSSDSSTSEEPSTVDACYDGRDAEAPADAGSGRYCMTATDNGDHCHPLTLFLPDELPSEGITYLLEDGGTGHTHTVTVGIYDIGGLLSGGTQTFQSTEDAGHTHMCRLTCPTE